MKANSRHYLEIEIDRLTNCIAEVVSGVSFDTEIHEANKEDIKLITKKKTLAF